MIAEEVRLLDWHEALVLCMNDMGDVAKGREAKIKDGFTYKFSNIDDLLDVVKPVAAKWGFALTQPLGSASEGRQFTVTCVLVHFTGESYKSDVLARPAPTDPRAFGSEVTYARRYALQSFLSLATDDDDGKASSDALRAPPPQEAAPAGPTADMTKRVTAQFKRTGIDGAPARNQFMQETLGHPVESWSKLTLIEAVDVLIAVARLEDCAPADTSAPPAPDDQGT